MIPASKIVIHRTQYDTDPIVGILSITDDNGTSPVSDLFDVQMQILVSPGVAIAVTGIPRDDGSGAFAFPADQFKHLLGRHDFSIKVTEDFTETIAKGVIDFCASITGGDVVVLPAPHSLLASNLQLISEVGSPGVSSVVLFSATGTVSVSTASRPSIVQLHSMLASDVAGVTSVGSPSVGQSNLMLAVSLVSNATVESALLGSDSGFDATDVASASTVLSVPVGQVHAMQSAPIESNPTVAIVSVEGGYSYLTGEQAARTALSFEDTDAYPRRQALLTNADMANDLRADGKTIIDHSTTGDDRDPQPGRYHKYDGTNDYATRGARLTSGSPAVLSVAITFRTTSTSVSMALFGEYYSSGNRSWVVLMSSGKIIVNLSANGTGTQKYYQLVPSYNDGEWHALAFVFNAGELTIYMDGVEVALTKAIDLECLTLYNTTEPFAIGAYNTSITSSSHYSGHIKNAGVWSAAITAAEILALATPATAHLIPQPGSCLFFSHCEGNDPTRVWDASGNGNHLTPSGITAATFLAEGGDALYSAADEVGWSSVLRTEATGSGYATIPNYSVSDSANTTISVDFSCTSAVGMLLGNYDAANNPGIYLVNATTIRLGLQNGTTDFVVPAINDGLKHNVTAVWHSNGDVSLYLDGTFISTANIATGGSWQFNSFGRRFSGSYLTAHYWRCLVYASVLSSGDIGTLASGSEVAGYARSYDFNNDDGMTLFGGAYFVVLPRDESNTVNDVLGNPLDYSGRVPFDGTLIGSPCITLDGTNDYALLPNSTDFSGEDWTLTGKVIFDDVSANKVVLSQQDGSGTGTSWLFIATGEWRVNGATPAVFSGLPLAVVDTIYDFQLSKSGTSYTLTVNGLSETKTATFASANGNFVIGSGKSISSNLSGKLWNIKLDHANGFDIPCSDQYGDYLTNRVDPDNPAKLTNHTLSSSWANVQDEFHLTECDVVPWFNGSNSKIDVATANWTDISAGFTFACKFRVDSLATTQVILGNASALNNRIDVATDGKITLQFGGSSSGVNAAVSATGLITTGVWHDLQITWNGSTAVMTLDDVEVVNQAVSTPVFSSGLFVVGQRNAAGDPLTGAIASISMSGAFAYDCDQGSNTFTDTSGNGNNGTGSNLTWLAIPTQTDGSSTVGRTTPTWDGTGGIPLGWQTQVLRSGGIDSVEATRQGWDLSTGFAGGDGQETTPNYHDGEAGGPYKEFFSFLTASVSIELAPLLTSPPAKYYARNQAIPTLSIPNSGGSGTWVITGLPAGLTYDTNTGDISGTVDSGATIEVANITATCTNGTGSDVANFTIEIMIANLITNSDSFPYELGAVGETYLLAEDIVVDGTAFLQTGDSTTLHGGGYSVTYNNAARPSLANENFDSFTGSDPDSWTITGDTSHASVAKDSSYIYPRWMLGDDVLRVSCPAASQVAATLATGSPAVITMVGHGLVTGDAVILDGFTATVDGVSHTTLVNGGFYITKLTDDTFSIPINVTAVADANGLVRKAVAIKSSLVNLATANRLYTANCLVSSLVNQPTRYDVSIKILDSSGNEGPKVTSSDDPIFYTHTYVANESRQFSPAVTVDLASSGNYQIAIFLSASGALDIDVARARITASYDCGVIGFGSNLSQLPQRHNWTAASATFWTDNHSIKNIDFVQGNGQGFRGWSIVNRRSGGDYTLSGVTCSINGDDTLAIMLDHNTLGAPAAHGTCTIDGVTITGSGDQDITRRFSAPKMIMGMSWAGDVVLNDLITYDVPYTSAQVSTSDPSTYSCTLTNIECYPKSNAVNCYALGVSSNTSIDGLIIDSVTDPNRCCRGLYVGAGQNQILEDVVVTNASVKIRELFNRERATSGGSTRALRIRNTENGETTNGTLLGISISNSTFEAVHDGAEQLDQVRGMRMSVRDNGGGMNAVDNITFDNVTFKGTSIGGGSADAAGVEFGRHDDSLETISLLNCTFESNHHSIIFGGNDDTVHESSKVRILDGTIIKNVLDGGFTYASYTLTGYAGTTTPTPPRFINMTYSGGATDTVNWSNVTPVSAQFGWVLDITVEDAATDPVVGAAVTVKNTSAATVASGVSDAGGLVSGLEVIEELRSWNGSLETITNYNDHTVEVTATGFANYSAAQTIDQLNEAHTASLEAEVITALNGGFAAWGWHPVGLLAGYTHVSRTMSSAGHYVAQVLSVPESGIVTDLAVTIGVVTSAADITIGLETVGTDGLPTGSSYGGSTAGSLTGAYSAGTKVVALGSSATVVQGDLVAVVVRWSGAAGNIGVSTPGGGSGTNMSNPYHVLNGSRSTGPIEIGLKYNDGSYPAIPGSYPPVDLSTAQVVIDDDGAGTEQGGLLFQMPKSVRAVGLFFMGRVFGGASDTFQCHIRSVVDGSTLGTALASTGVLTDLQTGNTVSGRYITFSSGIDLDADTEYRLVIEALGSRTADIQLHASGDLAEDAMMGMVFNTNCKYTSWNGSAWADDPSVVPNMALIIDGT